jgi:hypothetical protein
MNLKHIIKKVTDGGSWLFSILFIWIAARTAIDLLIPSDDKRCGTGMFAVIIAFLFPMSFIMAGSIKNIFIKIKYNIYSPKYKYAMQTRIVLVGIFVIGVWITGFGAIGSMIFAGISNILNKELMTIVLVWIAIIFGAHKLRQYVDAI